MALGTAALLLVLARGLRQDPRRAEYPPGPGTGPSQRAEVASAPASTADWVKALMWIAAIVVVVVAVCLIGIGAGCGCTTQPAR